MPEEYQTPIINFSTYKKRPEWREYSTRRFQNKMESLSLQEHQSELRLRAAEMARNQKIKNLDDRLRSQDVAIELMRQRHRNQTTDLKDLCGRYTRCSSVLSNVDKDKNVFCKSSKYDTQEPMKDLQKFTKFMDERYEKLKEKPNLYERSRCGSLQPFNKSDGVSYRNVKEMLNHLPMTPIFKETTCSLMRLSANEETSQKNIDRNSDQHVLNGMCSKSQRDMNVINRLPMVDSFRSVREQRDVLVPSKDTILRSDNKYLPIRKLNSLSQNSTLKKNIPSYITEPFDSNTKQIKSLKNNIIKNRNMQRGVSLNRPNQTNSPSMYTDKSMIFSK